MRAESFDVIVAGGGVVGLSAAYHFARDGKSVLLLEQSDIGHDGGQSYGESRMFSLAYRGPEYTRLALQSEILWRNLEAISGWTVFFQTGGIDMWHDADAHAGIIQIRNNMSAFGIAHEMWDHRMLLERIPAWRVDENIVAIYSPRDAILHPERTIGALYSVAVISGAWVREHDPVTGIRSDGADVEVRTSGGLWHAKNLVVACGVWTNRVLAHLGVSLPIQSVQEQTVYFRPRANAASFMRGAFPMWYHRKSPIVYGFPVLEKFGIKLGFHLDGSPIEIESYKKTPDPSTTSRLREYLERYLPDAAGESFDERTCLYDNTPDTDFIVDRLPEIPNVFVGAGFSGHGFNSSIAVGRALADLVSYGRTDIEISLFGIRRFANG